MPLAETGKGAEAAFGGKQPHKLKFEVYLPMKMPVAGFGNGR
jgi:hypothetical protein